MEHPRSLIKCLSLRQSQKKCYVVTTTDVFCQFCSHSVNVYLEKEGKNISSTFPFSAATTIKLVHYFKLQKSLNTKRIHTSLTLTTESKSI
jgi:hypothetical protein